MSKSETVKIDFPESDTVYKLRYTVESSTSKEDEAELAKRAQLRRDAILAAMEKRQTRSASEKEKEKEKTAVDPCVAHHG
eukprot:m.90824 g.90824  ORF g.90824 m.90824 type:complete len:80 (-) comp8480_c0_seq1:383-622(-)